ncbi:outer membrane protein assembly factor BamB family protein [Dactylosporangium darangshiense]|uniref:Pyrrolo-quinoline quinone repeat domain-containing protein n=1 Tax=Dactylosporangium darangshiense TaxID=579108 RepID=A0ABP8DGV6_9ACTN
MIDLDVSGPVGPAPVQAPPSRRRWWLLGLLVVLLLPGDGPAVPPAPSVVLEGDGIGDMRADGDALFLLMRTAVAAYRMPGGARRWSVPVEPGAQLLAASQGRVVLSVVEPATGTASLVGLDAATGAQVWRRDGYVPSLPSGDGPPAVLIARADSAIDGRLLGLDIGTGAVRWELGTPAVRRVLTDNGRPEIADLDPGGTLLIRDAGSAAVVRTVALSDLGTVDGFDISGDRLLVYRFERTTLLDTAVFDLTTGRRLWQHTDMAAAGGLWWCGTVLCTGSVGRTTVVDPDTGDERWSVSGWTHLGPFDAGHMWATEPTPNAADPSLGAVVLDAATGRVVRRFGAWDVVAALPGRAALVTDRNPGGSLVGRLDLATGAVTVLGRAEHWPAPPQCLATARLVACHRERVSVWLL